MNEKFWNYDDAATQAAILTLHFGNLGYHTFMSLSSDKQGVEVRVFVKPNEVLNLPPYLLYSRSKVSHLSEDENTPAFDVIYYYFEY